MEFYKDKFKEIRKAKKLFMHDLANLAGVSRESISIWERGVRSPNIKHIKQLAQALGVCASEISDLPPTSSSSMKLSNIRESWIEFVADNDNLSSKIKVAQATINLLKGELDQIKLILKALTSSLSSIFYIKDINNRYVIANDAFLNNISYLKAYKVIGKSDSDFFYAGEAKANIEEDKLIIESGEKIINKEDYIPGSRRKKIALKTKVPILDSFGNTAGMFALYTDITKQKEIEKQRILLEKVINGVDCYIAVVRNIGKKSQKFKLEFINDYTFINAFDNIPVCDDLTSLWKSSAPKHYNAFVKHVNKNKNFPICYERTGIDPKTQKPITLSEKIFKPYENHYFIISHDITEPEHLKQDKKMLLDADSALNNTILWGGTLIKDKTDIKFNFASDKVDNGNIFCVGTTIDNKKSENTKKSLMKKAQDATIDFYVNQKVNDIAKKLKSKGIDPDIISFSIG